MKKSTYKEPAYPVLAQLMAKYGMNRGHISEIIGMSYRNSLKKYNGETMYDIIEGAKIAKFFKDKGENVTIEYIFSLDGNKREQLA